MRIEGPYILRTYGRRYDDQEFDNLFGFLRSKDKKTKDKLDIQSKQADIQLKVQEQVKQQKAIEAEAAKAQAEQMRAATAQKLAETADVNLQEAKARKQLIYIGIAIGGLVIVGGVAYAVYMFGHRKKGVPTAPKVAQVNPGVKS